MQRFQVKIKAVTLQAVTVEDEDGTLLHILANFVVGTAYNGAAGTVIQGENHYRLFVQPASLATAQRDPDESGVRPIADLLSRKIA